MKNLPVVLQICPNLMRLTAFLVTFSSIIFHNVQAQMLETEQVVNKMVYLISPPRSMSTISLRMWENRGDFLVKNEPYAFSFWKKSTQYTPDGIDLYKYFRDDSLANYQAVQQKIIEQLKTRNVFIKEMSFAFEDASDLDESLITNPNAYFIFLVRNPHSMIISFYKKLQETEGFSVADMEPIGYKSSYRVFEKVVSKGRHEPIIILSEELCAQPETIVQSLCKKLDLSFSPSMLQWSNLGNDFDGHEAWGNLMHKEYVQIWHGSAIKSTKFMPAKTYEIDEQQEPTFSEISNQDDRVICRRLYLEQLKFYQLLLAQKQFILSDNCL